MSNHISRGTSTRTALVPQEELFRRLNFSEKMVFIRRENQAHFPDLEFRAGKAYGVYHQSGRLLNLYGGDHSHAFEGALIDGYTPQWMH